jgi:hypothetical protein
MAITGYRNGSSTVITATLAVNSTSQLYPFAAANVIFERQCFARRRATVVIETVSRISRTPDN